jgi:2-methylisocitrate lyase-like PEP mutase family enzyme
MRAQAEMIASLASDPSTSSHPNGPIPLISDADTGYGGPIMVARTVQQYAHSGVAGLHIEDQVQTKRCGHLAGKELVDVETYGSRIRAAVQARRRIGSDIIIIARTDALQSYGYDEAISRLRLAHAAGADLAFLEGITSREEARRAVTDLAPMPCLLNMVEHGATPSISAGEAKEMGFKIIIFPFAALAPAYSSIKTAMEKLKREGCLDTPREMTPQALFRICGVEDDMRIDADAGGKSYKGGID